MQTQREIKFRAWDGKEMLYDVLAGASSQNVCDFDDDDVWWWHEPPEAIMQFTGLKDKNGKEIYEGDIVKRLPESKYPFSWAIGWSNSDPVGFDLCKEAEYEIIGNIYENPELRNQK